MAHLLSFAVSVAFVVVGLLETKGRGLGERGVMASSHLETSLDPCERPLVMCGQAIVSAFIVCSEYD